MMRGGRIAPGATTWLAGALAAALLLAPQRAPSAQPPASEPPPCELHVWPTAQIDSRSSGWLSMIGLVGTAIDRAAAAPGDRRRRDAVAEILDPATQGRLLAAADPAHLLPIGPARLVVHPEPVEPRSLRRLQTRRADPGSPCYSELYVRRIAFRRSALRGRRLVAEFALRRFDRMSGEGDEWAGRGETPLAAFPPRDEAGVEAAAEELRNGFVRAFRAFATEQLMRASPEAPRP